MDSVWWLFLLVCAVVLCAVMAGATDAPLEQGRINQLSVNYFLESPEFKIALCLRLG